MKKAQKGVTTKKGRTTMNITDTSGYAAGKKAGYPAQMISPKTKYSKGDTTNVTVNRNTVSKAIKKNRTGGTTIKKAQNGNSAKKTFDKNKDPKLGFTNYQKVDKTGYRTEEFDTTGFAAGRRKNFPMKITQTGRKPEYRNMSRDNVKDAINYSKDSGRPMPDRKDYISGSQMRERYDNEHPKNWKKWKTGGSVKKSMKTGGMTKKCKYGCK